jgi:hypothetical protein
LYMTDDYKLSAFTKEHLIYTPAPVSGKAKVWWRGADKDR